MTPEFKMYNEEYFNESDETNTTISNSDSSTMNSIKYEKNRINKEFKRLDKGYRKIKKNISRNTTIELYYTSIMPDSNIRNAISGERTKLRVGRKLEESLFFSVCFSTGELAHGPYILFYNSPEQYEKHQNINGTKNIRRQ